MESRYLRMEKGRCRMTNRCPNCKQIIVPRASEHLVKYALAKGCSVTVDDGGDELALRRSKDAKEIMEAIDAVDESELFIHGPDGKRIAWVLIVLGNDPDEEVADCSDNAFMTAWWEAYEKRD